MDNKEETEQWSDVKSKNKYPIVIVLIVVLLIIGGLIFMNRELLFGNSQEEPKEDKQSEESVVPQEEVAPSIPDGMTSAMYDFINHYTDEKDGRNILDIVGKRIFYITLELKDVRQESTGDTGQSVFYTDYETFKNKYEEIFGTNYKADEDLAKDTIYGSKETCNGHPSVEGKNNYCWPSNLGVVGPISLTIENQSSDLIEGKYEIKFSDSTKETGVFTITYAVDNDKSYLKSVSIKKD